MKNAVFKIVSVVIIILLLITNGFFIALAIQQQREIDELLEDVRALEELNAEQFEFVCAEDVGIPIGLQVNDITYATFEGSWQPYYTFEVADYQLIADLVKGYSGAVLQKCGKPVSSGSQSTSSYKICFETADGHSYTFGSNGYFKADDKSDYYRHSTTDITGPITAAIFDAKHTAEDIGFPTGLRAEDIISAELDTEDSSGKTVITNYNKISEIFATLENARFNKVVEYSGEPSEWRRVTVLTSLGSYTVGQENNLLVITKDGVANYYESTADRAVTILLDAIASEK